MRDHFKIWVYTHLLELARLERKNPIKRVTRAVFDVLKTDMNEYRHMKVHECCAVLIKNAKE